jgi:hypothetical protein
MTNDQRIVVRHHFLALSATRATFSVEAVDLEGVVDRVHLTPG